MTHVMYRTIELRPTSMTFSHSHLSFFLFRAIFLSFFPPPLLFSLTLPLSDCLSLSHSLSVNIFPSPCPPSLSRCLPAHTPPHLPLLLSVNSQQFYQRSCVRAHMCVNQIFAIKPRNHRHYKACIACIKHLYCIREHTHLCHFQNFSEAIEINSRLLLLVQMFLK